MEVEPSLALQSPKASHEHEATVGRMSSTAAGWHFDTRQVHAGLESETAHGQCTLPVYNSASFKFKSSKSIQNAYDFDEGPESQAYMYSRISNVGPSPGPCRILA